MKATSDMHGRGLREHELYDMPARPPDAWAAVTDVPCPVPGCSQTVLWYEAGYVPGYRVCMAPDVGGFDIDTLSGPMGAQAGPNLESQILNIR